MTKIVDRQVTELVESYIFESQTILQESLVYKKALWHFIDCLGCLIGWRHTPLWKLYLAYWDTAKSLIWSSMIWENDGKWPLPTSAFISSGLINAADYDDTSVSWGHPGATVIGTALAIAWAQDVKLYDFLVAVICGYDVIHFVKKGTEPSWERYQEVHGIGTSQSFWAFAVTARLCGLDRKQVRYWLGLTAAFSPVPHACKYGWQEERLISVKDNIAFAAQSGTQAALLAKLNFVWSDSIFDWDRGFSIMSSSDQNNLVKSALEIGSNSILESCIKPYPCCRWIHGALDAVEDLWTECLANLAEIRSIEVECMPSIRDIFDNPHPYGHIEGQFSIQHNLALRLLGIPNKSWNSPDELQILDAEVSSIRKKILLISNPIYQDIYLAHDKDPSWIPFHLKIRTKTKEYVAYRECSRWGLDNPLWEEELVEKFLENFANRSQGQSILQRITTMKPEESISRILFNTN